MDSLLLWLERRTKKYIFLLGYYDKDSSFMEIFINKYEINPETINERIRNQADTHYQII